jgi:hypothetical protein
MVTPFPFLTIVVVDILPPAIIFIFRFNSLFIMTNKKVEVALNLGLIH